MDALLDHHPASGPFRLTAGLVVNGNRVDAIGRSTAAGTYTLGGVTYSVAEVGRVDGQVEFRRLAPCLGIGWGRFEEGKGWNLSADLGAILQGSPRTELTSADCTAPANICAQFAEDLAAENQVLAGELKDFKWFVVRLGATYRFLSVGSRRHG